MVVVRYSFAVFCFFTFLNFTLAQNSVDGDDFGSIGNVMTSDDKASLPVDDEARVAASGNDEYEEKLRETLLDYGIDVDELPPLVENAYGLSNENLTSDEVDILLTEYDIFVNFGEDDDLNLDDDYSYYDDYLTTTTPKPPTTTTTATASTTTTTQTTTTLLASTTTKQTTRALSPVVTTERKTDETTTPIKVEPPEPQSITTQIMEQKSTAAKVLIIPDLLDITVPKTTTLDITVPKTTTLDITVPKTTTTNKASVIATTQEFVTSTAAREPSKQESTPYIYVDKDSFVTVPVSNKKVITEPTTISLPNKQIPKVTTSKARLESTESTTEKKLYFDILDENGLPIEEELTTVASRRETKPVNLGTTKPKIIITQDDDSESKESTTTKRITTIAIKPRVNVDAKTTKSDDEFDVDDNSDATSSKTDLQKSPAAAGMSTPMMIVIVIAIALLLIILIIVCAISHKRKSGKYDIEKNQPQDDSRADEQLIENGHNSKTNGHSGPVPVKNEAEV